MDGPDAPPRSTRPARLPAAERRQQILEVATRVFARLGYVQASTSEIATQAGISEPTIYRHFENKQALYLAVLEHTTDELLGAWRQIVEAAPDPLSALSRMSTWYQQQLAVRPQLRELRFRSFAATDDPVIAEAVRAGYLEVIELVRGLFERAIDEGRLPRHLDPLLPTTLFLALGALTDVVEHLDLAETLGGARFANMGGELSSLFKHLPSKR
jgi:AcrR family transcriptional regulator